MHMSHRTLINKINMQDIDIRKIRADNLLSQAELARTLGVSRQTINLWERGLVVPSAKQIIKLRSLQYGIKE